MKDLIHILWKFNAYRDEKGGEIYLFNGYKYSLESSLYITIKMFHVLVLGHKSTILSYVIQ